MSGSGKTRFCVPGHRNNSGMFFVLIFALSESSKMKRMPIEKRVVCSYGLVAWAGIVTRGSGSVRSADRI